MKRITASREDKLNRTLSFRLTEYQFSRVQRTIRNYGIQGSSPSDQLRLLLRRVHWSSVRYHAKHRELRRLQLLKENEAKALKSITVS